MEIFKCGFLESFYIISENLCIEEVLFGTSILGV